MTPLWGRIGVPPWMLVLVVSRHINYGRTYTACKLQTTNEHCPLRDYRESTGPLGLSQSRLVSVNFQGKQISCRSWSQTLNGESYITSLCPVMPIPHGQASWPTHRWDLDQVWTITHFADPCAKTPITHHITITRKHLVPSRKRPQALQSTGVSHYRCALNREVSASFHKWPSFSIMIADRGTQHTLQVSFVYSIIDLDRRLSSFARVLI